MQPLDLIDAENNKGDVIPGSSGEWTKFGDMLQNPRCGNNAGIDRKEIGQELKEYLINKGEIIWQRKQSLKIFKIYIFALAL